jgi:hypothetical protein
MAKGKTEAAAETTQRERWEFNKTKLSEGYQERQIHIFEFIAHYLEGIEIQLGRIADAVESGKVNEPVRRAISDLEGMAMMLNQMKE